MKWLLEALMQPATALVHPTRTPDLLALPDRLRQRRLHHRARHLVTTYRENRADETLHADPGVPEGGVGHLCGRMRARAGAERCSVAAKRRATAAGTRGGTRPEPSGRVS